MLKPGMFHLGAKVIRHGQQITITCKEQLAKVHVAGLFLVHLQGPLK